MNEARESFAKFDATSLDSSATVDIPMGASGDTHTVEFEEVTAETEAGLEQALDERAAQVLEEAGLDSGQNLGYEVIREDGETYRRVGFVIAE